MNDDFRPQRRTVVRGAAWTAPAVVLVTALPASGATCSPNSPGCGPVKGRQCGTVCKHPGSGGNDKTYHFTFCFTTDQVIVGGVVNIVSMTVNGVSSTELDANGNPKHTLTPTTVTGVIPGVQKCVYVDATSFPDSANGSATLYFTYSVTAGGITETFSDQISVQLNGIERCGTSDGGVNPKDYPHPGAEPAANVCTA